MNDKENKNKPLLFIDSIQIINNKKDTSQNLYDSRYNKKKIKKEK